ncbi:MAG: 4-(cytidine 5'-diphospho)-2-C-methyl-D-erythritol kinase [Spirochaetes bacterium]|nr:4-(cytidine 5'-diphospho)-2-C-methyl-D-erythritol kinase [Spirochaetota bacterium]
MTYKARAFAKVNLHLEVLNKRSDLYHNIFSLNASLDLFDRLTFKRLNISNKFKDVRITIHPEGGECADALSSIETEDNLITKAVKAYLSRVKKTGEISVSIEKNIPAGAGMGGGSSDAAAALRLLNNYFADSNESLSEHELLQIGFKIGADVPYCLNGGYALCEGIGEIIENIEGKLKYWVLIANCGIKINTSSAYKSLNRGTDSIYKKIEIEEKKAIIKEGIKKGNINSFKNILKNDFESTVFSDHPELKNLKQMIAEYEPEYTAMTGSGSSIIGLFKNKQKAKSAQKALNKKAKIIVTKFL